MFELDESFLISQLKKSLFVCERVFLTANYHDIREKKTKEDDHGASYDLTDKE